MKKYILAALMVGVPLVANESNSLSLFDKETYQIGNVKKLGFWLTRMGWQLGKMNAGLTVFGWANPRGHDQFNNRRSSPNRLENSKALEKYSYRFGGGVLFLHGLHGIAKELGFDSLRQLFLNLEGKDTSTE